MNRHRVTLYWTRRYGCWSTCSCGWSGSRWTTVTGAHGDFGQHLIEDRKQ